MIESHDDDVFTVDDVLSGSECKAAIARAERHGFDDAPINAAGGFVIRHEVRNNTRVMYDDPALAAALWIRLVDAIPRTPRARAPGWTALGLNERFRTYRYEVNQQFRWHSDGAFRRHDREQSFFTLMVYLNDDFTGGATDFDGFSIRPRTGRALVFDHPLLHQGGTVTAGVKYVLRTDVMYRR